MQLSDHVGQVIVMLIPAIHPTELQKVKLLSVESGGIWIESQTFLNMMLKSLGQATAPRSLAFFFPYHELRYGFVAIEGVALNERAFGI